MTWIRPSYLLCVWDRGGGWAAYKDMGHTLVPALRVPEPAPQQSIPALRNLILKLRRIPVQIKKKLFMHRYRYYLNNTGIFMT